MSDVQLTIYQLIPKVMNEVGAVGKSGFNSFDKYKFRSIDDVYNALQPVLSRNGVFIVPRVLDSKETIVQAQSGKDQVRIKVKVEYKICAPDGSFVEAIFEGEGIDRSDKATNKAVQASFKYMVSQLFCLAFEGMDDADKESPEIPKMHTSAPLKTKIPPQTGSSQTERHQPAGEGPKPIVNHAPQAEQPNDVENYVLNFNFGTFKSGTKISSIKISDLKNLQTAVMSWALRMDGEGKPVPPPIQRFIEVSKLYLESKENV